MPTRRAYARRVSSRLLVRESASLVGRLRLWTPARWDACCPEEAQLPGTRADLVFHLATTFAALAGAPRTMPRLDSDLALPDQLAVTGDELARSGPGAEQVVDAVAHLLLHREHLLGDQVPSGLVAELDALDRLDPDSSRPDGTTLARRARRVCATAVRAGQA